MSLKRDADGEIRPFVTEDPYKPSHNIGETHFPTAHMVFELENNAYQDEDDDEAFHGRYDTHTGEKPRSMVELEIMSIGQAIRNKPKWYAKCTSSTIVNKWRKTYEEKETASRNPFKSTQGFHNYMFGGEEVEGPDLLQREEKAAFQYALEECCWLARQHASSSTKAAAVDGVFFVDDPDDELWLELRSEISKLRAVPAIGYDKEDRHPGTPQMVDIVHPSMYCYEQGKTLVLQNDSTEAPSNWQAFIGSGTEQPMRTTEEAENSARRNIVCTISGVQWLPSEVTVSESSVDGALYCTFNSYINSLHPVTHENMYLKLGELFCKALPALEEALAGAGTVGRPRQRPERVEIDFGGEHFRAWTEPIGRFSPPTYQHPKADISLCNRPLQVIVKIASLELEPEDGVNKYDGGTWHIEGAFDERIVATACCYVDTDNIEGGSLEFRTAVSEPDARLILQSDVYNFGDGHALVQPRGKCLVRSGGILAWPNTLQHCVKAAKLKDPTKPGKRTIVCFFLVEPSVRVRSTATVPPQQRPWMEMELQHVFRGVFPAVVVSQIAEYLPNLMSYEDSCDRRSRLMDERRAKSRTFSDRTLDLAWTDEDYSFCEH